MATLENTYYTVFVKRDEVHTYDLSLPLVRKMSNSMELYQHSPICLHGMMLIKQGQIYLLSLLGRREAGTS